MTNEKTIEKMNNLRLFGMARAFQSLIDQKQTLTSDETIAYLVDSEWDYKYNKKLERLLKNAKFRYYASFEELDYNQKRNLDKNQMIRFSNCSWINKNESVVYI